MKAKKLIEVALPIKEISAESVRDKTIHHGHISTLIPGGQGVLCQFVELLCSLALFQILWMTTALSRSKTQFSVF